MEMRGYPPVPSVILSTAKNLKPRLRYLTPPPPKAGPLPRQLTPRLQLRGQQRGIDGAVKRYASLGGLAV